MMPARIPPGLISPLVILNSLLTIVPSTSPQPASLILGSINSALVSASFMQPRFAVLVVGL